MKHELQKANLNSINPLEDIFDILSGNFSGYMGSKLDMRVPTEEAIKAPLEVDEKEDKIIVRAEIPGVDKKDINVSVENNVLTIEAEKKTEKREKGFSEFSYGKIFRQIRVPSNLSEDIDASYSDGVLKLKIPKVKKETNRIKIK